MSKASKQVRLDTRTVGQSFGTAGVVRDLRGRKIAETSRPYPFGFTRAALDGARSIAERKGWTVVA